MTTLLKLASDALATGWAVSTGTIEDVVAEARTLGWQPVPIRHGEPTVAILRPTRAIDARPRSLSAMVGLGRQPFHTDGAHLRRMPDVVVLAAGVVSPTPTLVVDPGTPTEPQLHGVFKVSAGRDTFYSAAADSKGKWRYDPGCMKPADERAHAAVRDFDRLTSRAVRHEWSQPDLVLVIANRRVLHARAAVEDPETREVHRVAFISGLDS